MIKPFTHLLFVVLFAASLLFSSQPQVKRFDIHGLDHFSAAEVKAVMNFDKGKLLPLNDMDKRCRSLLLQCAQAGYPFCKIDSLIYEISADSVFAEVDLFISEGPRLENGRLLFSGLSHEDSLQLSERIQQPSSKTLSLQRFEQSLDGALSYFEKNAYPFIRFELSSITLDSSKDHLALNVRVKTVQGPKLIIKEIQVIGNEVTQKKVIQREIRIKEGDLYNAARADKIRPRLMRLGFFNRVDEPEVFLATENEGGLLIRVEEGNSSRFDGVVGYTPGTGEEKGYFTGLIDLTFANLFGTGRSLAAHWQKRDRASQDLLFRYREPWIGGYPVHPSILFQQLVQDSSYVQREWGADLELPLLENISLFTTFRRSSVLPDSSGAAALGIQGSNTASWGASFSYDSRDDLLNPRQGIYYSTGVKTLSKRYASPILSTPLPSKVSAKSYSIDLEFFLPTFKRQVLSAGFHGRQLISSEKPVPLPDLFRMGGTKTLRGYREDQFRGSTVAWTNLEYRYIMGRRSRAFVFCDIGYYQQEMAETLLSAVKIGYGFGVRLETGLGIMGLDYGLAYGDKQGLMSGLLHVGLINEF